MPFVVSTFDEWTPLLFHPQNCSWALYETDEPLKLADVVEDASANLINSALHYPPALAMAKFELERVPFETKKELEFGFSRRLEYWLKKQAESSFILWRASASEGCDFLAGSYYWVVGFDGSVKYGESVYWVAGEYTLYPALLEHFEQPDILQAFLAQRKLGKPVRLNQ